VPSDTSLPKRSNGSSAGKPGKSSAKAYSYLNVVDGTPMRHSTWTECEQGVKDDEARASRRRPVWPMNLRSGASVASIPH
jgi:hypothetical protein